MNKRILKDMDMEKKKKKWQFYEKMNNSRKNGWMDGARVG